MQTRERVEVSATAAGIHGQKHCIQLLSFGEKLNNGELRLMEVNKDVMEDLQDGRSVSIRGEPHDEAVICTTNRTYEVKVVETSNTLLLAPDLLLPKDPEFVTYSDSELVPSEVNCCFSTYLELRECRPRTERVKHLLRECPYKGGEFEDESSSTGHKYTYNELLDKVQASEEQLQEALDRIHACYIDNYYRLLDSDYRDAVVVRILTLMEEEDWSYKEIPVESCCEILQELEPRTIIEHCLKNYGKYRISNDGHVLCELLEDKVCIFYAEYILRNGKKFNYREFMTNWQQAVPVGMVTSPEHLKAIALTDTQSYPPVISYFSAEDLSHDVTTRFNKLFRVREKWTQEDIMPYVKDLETPSVSAEALLLKHARVSTDPLSGGKMYNSKRPVH